MVYFNSTYKTDFFVSDHVEFCLLVDKKCDLPIAKEGQVFVYLEHNNKYLHLQFDPNRYSNIQCSFEIMGCYCNDVEVWNI